ncbi:MFS transporter, DHA1 family, inner membrane transport protein [Streptoalloteichus hindustanus]|uniref:MFS transporter, DHA1 family, inner membrane transport protein n=2 Tax=Streptoalloteichus hindustanus TaxID=2017 RepID=A0A1M5FRK2_STRHI|nr:MFS transporter, DHA1 family, inner membrane transport protein [Streptoalloteichus hindustanus]
MVGLLPGLSADLHQPIPVVGSLVTWYALVVTVAGPLVTVLMLRVPRRTALLSLVAVFVASNVVAAVAGGFATLVAARVVTALTHSTSFAVAVVIAVSMSPATSRGRAIAVVSTGWNLATVLGAPLGTWVGDHFGWRTTFWGISVLSALALAGIATLIPPSTSDAPSGVRAEVRALLDRRVAGVLAVAVVSFAGFYTLYTYIAPLLGDVSGFSASVVATLLVVFGVGALVGNAVGGRLADSAPWPSLCAALAGLAAVLGVFAFTVHVQWASAVTMFVLGAVLSAVPPLLQDRALAAAPAAPTLVTAVAASAINLGIAGGSKLGGAALDAGSSLADLTWIGALVALLSVPLAAYTASRRATPTTSEA